MNRRVKVAYDLAYGRLEFTVEPSDYRHLDDAEIETEVRDAIIADMKANVAAHALDMPSVVRQIRAALTEIAKEEAEEDAAA